MPYTKNTELPKGVQHVLPAHAQDIYREAYNSAHEQYKDPKKRRDNASLEEVSHRVAWSAVERKYEKNASGQWVEKGK
ncbi:MAG: cation transport regulator ChaB [Rickettsiales bacterium]|nr:cation transport regulator ChaB [Rickettsiales bacterium]|tara:strand:- start:91628 stop:91861 length:234 start_codon:yes stop_codon:yes gene_type:complete